MFKLNAQNAQTFSKHPFSYISTFDRKRTCIGGWIFDADSVFVEQLEPAVYKTGMGTLHSDGSIAYLNAAGNGWE